MRRSLRTAAASDKETGKGSAPGSAPGDAHTLLSLPGRPDVPTLPHWRCPGRLAPILRGTAGAGAEGGDGSVLAPRAGRSCSAPENEAALVLAGSASAFQQHPKAGESQTSVAKHSLVGHPSN